jgi:hypothetical protein
MQVDWAVMRRGADRLSVFVATLGWSWTPVDRAEQAA